MQMTNLLACNDLILLSEIVKTSAMISWNCIRAWLHMKPFIDYFISETVENFRVNHMSKFRTYILVVRLSKADTV